MGKPLSSFFFSFFFFIKPMPLCLCCRLFITDESELWENSSRQEAFPLNWSRSGLIKTSINFNRYKVKCRTSHRSVYKGNFLFNQTHNAPPSVHTISSVLSFTHSGEAKDCGLRTRNEWTKKRLRGDKANDESKFSVERVKRIHLRAVTHHTLWLRHRCATQSRI